MEIKQKVRFHNEFNVEVVRNGEVIQRAHAENIVLNSAYSSYICAGSVFPTDYMSFGTGQGTLSPARTTLFSALGQKPCNFVSQSLPTTKNGVATTTFRIQLTTEEYVGSTLTEVGFGYTSGIYTHALIKDSEGNPIAITKTDLDDVYIYGTVYASLIDGVGDICGFGHGNLMLLQLSGYKASDGGYANLSYGAWFCAGESKIPTQLSNLMPYTYGYVNMGTVTITKDAVNKKALTNRVRVPITSGLNGKKIREIVWGHTCAYPYSGYYQTHCRLRLPCPGVWEGYTFTNAEVATGDGTKTGFNLPHSDIVVAGSIVKVAGVEKTMGVDYTLNCVKLDCDLIGESIYDDISAEGTATTEYEGGSADSNLEYTGKPGLVRVSSIAAVAGNSPMFVCKNAPIAITYDFEKTYQTISPGRLGIVMSASGAYSTQVVLEASNDNANWTTITTLNIGGANTIYYSDFTPPTQKYRYWRIRESARSGGFSAYVGSRGFGRPILLQKENQLNFVSPPAAGAAITSTYKVEYIPKSTGFVLDIQASIQYSDDNPA